MLGCVLRVSGSKAHVRAFLARTSLPVMAVFVKGEPVFRGGKKLARQSGFNVSVSPPGGSDLPGQVRSAQRFINHHARELRRLRASIPSGSRVLDFGLWDRDLQVRPMASYELPASFIALLAKHGLAASIAFYPGGAEGLANPALQRTRFAPLARR